MPVRLCDLVITHSTEVEVGANKVTGLHNNTSSLYPTVIKTTTYTLFLTLHTFTMSLWQSIYRNFNSVKNVKYLVYKNIQHHCTDSNKILFNSFLYSGIYKNYSFIYYSLNSA